jgi:HD-like signal output (HDOD) protein
MGVAPVLETSAPSTAPGRALKRQALGALGKLPPFSPILNKLLATLAGEDISFSKLSELIEKDAVIAGNLLHLSNSALFARANHIASVRHALAILGVDKMRNAVLGMSISRMWNSVKVSAGWSMARFNMHSASVAILSDLMAQRLPVNDPEGAFVSGLFHDLGRLLIAMGLPVEFERLVHRHENSNLSWIECEQEILGFTHPELSAEALAGWKLPETIQIAARDHHNPAPFQPGEPVPLSCILDVANRHVNSMGESILPQRKTDPSGTTPIELFGFTPEVMEKLLADFSAEHDAMAGFFR